MGLKSTTTKLIHANFFFVDIVGLSDPTMSTKTQIKKINVLNDAIKECDAFKDTPLETLLVLPTGDGMCLGFLQGPEYPLLLATELQEKLAEYNKSKIPSETVRIRIGLHSGNCFLIEDIVGNKTVWGPGIILCRRVMDFGDDGHILLTPRLAEDLKELSDDYSSVIKPVHDFTIKHGMTLLIYSAYDGKSFGNPNHPTKGEVQRSRWGKEILKLQHTTLYSKIKVHLTIKDPKTMLVHHKRFYEIENISDEPIKDVLHGISTDIKKYSITDLKVNTYDEAGREMKISSISMDKPDIKEFTTRFVEPIVKGEKARGYTMEYETEEPDRYYENAFLIDCGKFELGLIYPKNNSIQEPILYDVNQETDKKTKSNLKPIITEDADNFTVIWKMESVLKGQTFRIDW